MTAQAIIHSVLPKSVSKEILAATHTSDVTTELLETKLRAAYNAGGYEALWEQAMDGFKTELKAAEELSVDIGNQDIGNEQKQP